MDLQANNKATRLLALLLAGLLLLVGAAGCGGGKGKAEQPQQSEAAGEEQEIRQSRVQREEIYPQLIPEG